MHDILIYKFYAKVAEILTIRTDKLSVRPIWHAFCVLLCRQHLNLTNMTHIQPLADRVLIEPQAAEEKTVSGIIIPDSAKEKPLRGTVLAVGTGTKDEQMVLKEGDTVLYGKYSGTEIEVDDTKYLIMKQSDVLAKIG